jgi:3-keto-5-aminohexanoate cleavage enzyme
VWQVIAIGRANLALTGIGLALGGNARAGMEDTLHLGPGRPTDGNLPLVERTVRLAKELGQSVADVRHTHEALGLARQ